MATTWRNRHMQMTTNSYGCNYLQNGFFLALFCIKRHENAVQHEHWIITHTSVWIHYCIIYVTQTYVLLSSEFVNSWLQYLCQTDICIIITHTSLWIHYCIIYVTQTYVLLSSEFVNSWLQCLCQTDICIIITHTSLWIHEWLHDLCQTYVLLSSDFMNSLLHDFYIRQLYRI